MESIIESMDVVSDALNDADGFDLQTEVVTFALQAMKDNPKLEISEAIMIGFNEWVK